MTTTLYAEDVTKVRRTNLVKNPSFEVDFSGWAGGTGDVLARSNAAAWTNKASQYVAQVTSAGNSPYVLLEQTDADAIPVVGGQWVGVRLWAAVDNTANNPAGVPFQLRTRLRFGTLAEGLSYLDSGFETWATFYTGRLDTLVVQVPAGKSQLRVGVQMFTGSTGTNASTASRLWVDGVIAVIADTQAAALAALDPYFDGDTPTAAGSLLTHAWTGTPNASTSVEREPTDGLSPTLVVNYQQGTESGVTVHRSLSGPPLIVRQQAARLPAGTYEMFCDSEDLALAIADLCNGERLVILTGDEVPGAPFVFTPTGVVQTTWNTPYKSWTASVPYQRMTGNGIIS